MRAPTPTAAAEAAVPVRAELIAYVDDQGSRQRQAARRSLLSLKDRLRAASAGLPRPADLVATQRQSLDLAGTRLSGGLRHFVQDRRLAFSRLAGAIQPRLVRQRHAELMSRLDNLDHRALSGLHKTTERARLTFDPRAARLAGSVEQAIERKRTHFVRLAPRLSPQPLRAELRQLQGQLAPLAQRLFQLPDRITADRRQSLSQLAKLLETLSYRSVLARGYALVQDDTGNVVSSAGSLKPGDALKLTFADGEVGANVSGAPPQKRKSPRSPSDDGSQESLF
jgi:exodeoxyribonuclease VII large subunit